MNTIGTIQYISSTHIDKDSAEKNKRRANSFQDIYLKEATFDEICNLLDRGSTIGRVGNSTRYLAIDIDESSVDISRVIEHFKGNKDVHISHSPSNNDLRYHILVNTHRNIDREDYNSEVKKEFYKINAAICTEQIDFMKLDDKASYFYQPFFGSSVKNEEKIILEDSKRLFTWVKKDSSPRFYIERGYKKRPSLNSADYCNKNNLLTVAEEQRFDIYLPSMTNGKWKKIAEGHRYNWARMIGAKLLMRIIYLNHTFDEKWTKFDFLDTFEWIIRTNVVKFDTFTSEFKTLSLFFIKEEWNSIHALSYEEQIKLLEPYFNCSKRQYKSRKYTPAAMDTIIKEHRFDENTILFSDKDSLKVICKEMLLDYYKFTEYVKSLKLEIAFEVVSVHGNKKHFVEGMTMDEFNQYCKVNNIDKYTKYRLKKRL